MSKRQHSSEGDRIKPADLKPDRMMPPSGHYAGPCMGGPLDGQHIVQPTPSLTARYFPGLKSLLCSNGRPRRANYYWSRFGYWAWGGYSE